MGHGTEDIRIVKSKRAIVQAMVALLQKKSFTKISVNDICQEALVSRSTFYVHFEDKYALMRFALDTIRLQMKEKTQELPPRERLRPALREIRDNAGVFHNIFLDDPNRELLTMLQHYFTSQFEEILDEQQNQGMLLFAPSSFMATFYAGGVASCIGRWIENGFSESLDEITQNFAGLLTGLFPQAN